MTQAVVRPAARVVILDPADNILLQRIATNEGWDGWITPGGAIEEGESAVDAALRELNEEIGLRDVVLGDPIWTRRHIFPWNGVTYDQRETFFLARVTEQVEPAPAIDPAQLALEGVVDQRWWSLPELEAADVETAPRDLVELVRRLLAEGAPRDPIDVGA